MVLNTDMVRVPADYSRLYMTDRRILDELSRFSVATEIARAENAFHVATKFMDILRKSITNDRDYDLVMKAWFRAVKDEDFTKFRRVYRKYVS